jgi:hypothetical protein
MGIFKKKTEADHLRKQYKRLMKEAYNLSRTDRKGSDKKYAEADALMDRIHELESNTGN